MEGGLGDGVGHLGGDALHVVGVHVLELVQVVQGPVHALLPHGAAGGVLHALDILVDLLTLDALQVVAHAHVEHEAVGVAQAQFLGQQLAGEPALHVLVKGLGHVQLGGPLAVVALVVGGDAGLGHALGELIAVHDLHRLELKEPGTGGVGGHQVLGQLGVGTGGGAVGGLDLLLEHGQGLAVVVAHQLGHAEDGALALVLGQDPVHQVGKGNGAHNVAHTIRPPNLIR